MLVPKLRFKREDGTEYPEWGNKSFANAFAPLNNNTFSRDMLSENGTVLNIHYGDILVKFGEVCDIQAMDIPKVNAEIDTSKYDELQDGDIILADTAEDETVGKAIEIYHTGTSKVVSGLHTMACRPNDKYAPKYMGYYINSPTYHNQLFPFMQGIKVTSIGRKNIADTVIYYPADLEEQQKIADFLSAVDEVIAQSEAEVQNLEQQKKAAMQKIFSQEVRFKREDGTDYPEWEDCILSDYCEEIKSSIDPKKYPNDTFLEYSMPAFDMDKTPSTVIGSDMNSNRKIVSNPCVLINKLNVRKKRIWKVPNPTNNSVCSAEFIPVTSNKMSIDFLEHLALSDRFTARLLDCSTGTSNSQKRVTPDIIMDMPITIPCLEEQQKIADFLSAYDEAISYAKQELDKWKELKKGLLQQMFV